MPDDGVAAPAAKRGDGVWVSWPVPLAALPRHILAVVTCRYDPAKDDPATHHHTGTCRVWNVDFGSHEWVSWPLDLPGRPRDLGTLEPLDRDSEREINFLLADASDAFLDTLGGWPPASKGWDAARANAHRLGELLARGLTSESMRLYWQVDGRFFRWVETAAELDVMGRGGRPRPCAKAAPGAFDHDGIAPQAVAASVPTRRDGCLRLTRPILTRTAGDPPGGFLLPPHFVIDTDPELLTWVATVSPERLVGTPLAPDAVSARDQPDLETKLAAELPRVVALFVRRGPLGQEERDAVIAYEDDFFRLHDRKLEPVYRGIAPDFFQWLDEVRAGSRTPL